MSRLAGVFLVVGLGSELFVLLAQDGSPVAQFVGFTGLTLACIFLMLGSRSLRNLVG